jgi:uncharacterized membrane protein
MAEEKSPTLHVGFAKLTLTERDRKVFNLLGLCIWPFFAAGLIEAVRTGDIHKSLTAAGAILIVSGFLVGKEGLRIFAMQPGSTSEKLVTSLAFAGLLLMATGWAYRLLY